jgi:hypothetical protein
MADDHPDDQRDEGIAAWLEPEPLDELTRRRLVATAMQASAPEAATTAASPPSRAWRWIATAAVIVVLLVGALALFTAQGGNQETALNNAGKKPENRSGQTQQPSPSIGATVSPVDVGDFGDLDTPANLRRLRTALEQQRSAAVAPTNGFDANSDANAGAEATSNQLSTLACRDQLPAGTVTAVGSGTLDGRRALVVLTDRGDGSRSIDAVLADPCEVRPLS